MRLGNWRVRSRLVALILLPTVVGVLFAGVQLTESISTSTEYRRLTQVAQLVADLDELTHELAMERDLTAWFIADRQRPARFSKVQEQQDKVDQPRGRVLTALQSLDEAQPARVLAQARRITGWLQGLTGLREGIIESIESQVPARAALGMYTRMISDLSTLHEDLGRNTSDERLFGDSIALSALNRSKENLARSRGILTVALTERKLDYDDLSDFLNAVKGQDTDLATFQREASPEAALLYKRTVRGLMVERAHQLRSSALAQFREFKAIQDLDRTTTNDVRRWFDSTSASIDLMREVEKKLGAQVVAESQALQDAEQRSAIVSGVLILVLLAVVLAITALVASSLTRPLRRLRREALEIAGSRLPDQVQKLRESGENADAPEVLPIGVTTSDEIGEVARAFDEVHREAIRLAGDEAKLRSNVNSMFVNLSRRTQTLVERQLSLIEGLEQGEQDEQRLGNLFKLDHLATRMRRNSENLLVLAGQEPARRWGQPVPVVDVVRASLSEVENYERVNIQVQSGVSVVGQSVNDVVHLVAELVENAISFSPRETKVTVSSNRIDGGGLMISVSDVGIGMTAEELGQANWRLANPPVVDVSVSRRMGLFVVGRLALRHGIRVQLRQQDVGGLTAMVLLPEALLSQAPAAFAGMPPQQALPTGPQPFGLPPAPAFGQPALASPTAYENPQANPFDTAGRSPVFGADAPGVGAPEPWQRTGRFEPLERTGPQSAAERGPFDSGARGPFDTGPHTNPFGSARNPFDPPQGGRNPFDPVPDRNPFDPAPPARDPFDPAGRSPFDSGAFTNPGNTTFGTTTGPTPFDSGAFNTGSFAPTPFNNGSPVDTPWPGQLPPPGSSTWPGTPTPAPPDGGSWPGRPLRGPFEPDADNTGPLPVVRSSPLEEIDEFLPIFAAVESDWFRRATPGTEESGADANTEGAAPDAKTKVWSSPADAGWQAAQAAAEPSLGGMTSSGLPKRVPKANLVPGSADSSPTPAAQTAASAPMGMAPGAPTGALPPSVPPMPPLSPDRVRSRLASFQQGIRQGRAVARGDISEEQGWPGAVKGGPESDKDEA
ncbi:nitrate- and nitrite sensing domain-containing protein [Acrocarpospora catenulata]|uniref:nitrate- and nitrite sensing domain-containing protein n=1 Tax=Acrocarpospora catenulata TaxID=2836182 RepID=UPI001BDA57F3|nr:nitrate- and nitrite sensing domain-containing protein [Acrocarpospora catenulata]